MSARSSLRFRQLAVDCVSDMGDVFWDYKAERDAPRQYRDPHEIAVEAIERAINLAVQDVVEPQIPAVDLREEYETLISELGNEPSDEAIVGTLVVNASWTDRGAQEILSLAQRYGTSILCNALALAEAMKIEDGDFGL